jgi:type I restriction enzyme S subunit
MKPNSTIKLSDIAEINPPRHQLRLNDNDLVTFIPMSDVTDSARWVNRQSRALREVRHGYTVFRDGDVLFAKITPCMENGKGCLVEGLVNGVGYGSTEFHVLRARPNGHPGFIFQWTTAPELRLKAAAHMTGSAGQQRVPATFLEQFQIPHVSYEEQAAIAEILTTVDQAIEQTEALIAKQRRIKAGLLHDLLTRGIDEHGNLRDPTTHRFKESPVGLVPEEWEVEEFGRYVESSAFGPRFSSALYAENGSAAMLRTTDLDDEGNIISRTLPKANLDLNTYARHFLQRGDVVISRSGTIGITTVFANYEVPVIPAAFMIRFRLRETIRPAFIRYLFNAPLGRRLIYSNMAGGVQSNITATALGRIAIPVPNFYEQDLICEMIEEASQAIQQVQLELDKLKLIRAGLMHDLLGGNWSISYRRDFSSMGGANDC